MKNMETVNCHHNYASIENHHGKQVIIVRKGAIRAGKGDVGIIPGSMGTTTYIITGKGNADSMCSAPHGAVVRSAVSKPVN